MLFLEDAGTWKDIFTQIQSLWSFTYPSSSDMEVYQKYLGGHNGTEPCFQATMNNNEIKPCHKFTIREQ